MDSGHRINRKLGLCVPLGLYAFCVVLAFIIGRHDSCGRGADAYLWFGAVSAVAVFCAPVVSRLFRNVILSLLSGAAFLAVGWAIFFWAFAASNMSLFCITR